MLPERLSNGICSLNPNVDRLTQSAIMEITPKGKVVNHKICQSVINTTFRMTYSDVNEMLAGNPEKIEQFKPIMDSVSAMAELHKILEDMRERRGALNFDTSEARILVNEKGMPVDIVVRERGTAERMIESFMLAANECVAEHFAKLSCHLFTVSTKSQKLRNCNASWIMPLSLVFKSKELPNKMDQLDLQEFMAKVQGKPGAEVMNMMLLRSMQQARYSEHNHGHYGLAAQYYTHFTSPIRRYPDLLVHRMIREYTNNMSQETREHFEEVIPELATSSSTLERRAIDAERVVEAMKKAEYMEEFVGQEFDGIVGSVVKFGMFVELPNTIEGLVHITTLPEFYNYNERTMTLQGEKTGKTFRVGQPIRVKLTRADKETGDIDFQYLPSEYDVTEKVDHKARQEREEKAKASAIEVHVVIVKMETSNVVVSVGITVTVKMVMVVKALMTKTVSHLRNQTSARIKTVLIMITRDVRVAVVRKKETNLSTRTLLKNENRMRMEGLLCQRVKAMLLLRIKKARHDYSIVDTIEAGIVLTGTEIKSVRAARIQLKDGYAQIKNGEAWLINVHIAPFEQGNIWNQDPDRTRKLLLKKKQITKLQNDLKGTGMTLVPLKVYLKNGFAKVLLGIAKGKHDYDKRESIKRREQERDIKRIIKSVNR